MAARQQQYTSTVYSGHDLRHITMSWFSLPGSNYSYIVFTILLYAHTSQIQILNVPPPLPRLLPSLSSSASVSVHAHAPPQPNYYTPEHGHLCLCQSHQSQSNQCCIVPRYPGAEQADLLPTTNTNRSSRCYHYGTDTTNTNIKSLALTLIIAE